MLHRSFDTSMTEVQTFNEPNHMAEVRRQQTTLHNLLLVLGRVRELMNVK